MAAHPFSMIHNRASGQCRPVVDQRQSRRTSAARSAADRSPSGQVSSGVPGGPAIATTSKERARWSRRSCGACWRRPRSLLGAGVAVLHQPHRRALGLVMGFGAGVLLSAVSFELVEEAVETYSAGPARPPPGSSPAPWSSSAATGRSAGWATSTARASPAQRHVRLRPGHRAGDHPGRHSGVRGDRPDAAGAGGSGRVHAGGGVRLQRARGGRRHQRPARRRLDACRGCSGCGAGRRWCRRWPRRPGTACSPPRRPGCSRSSWRSPGARSWPCCPPR